MAQSAQCYPIRNGALLNRIWGLGSPRAGLPNCDVTVSTIQRGEAGDRWDDSTFSKVATALTTLTGKTIMTDDLKNLKK